MKFSLVDFASFLREFFTEISIKGADFTNEQWYYEYLWYYNMVLWFNIMVKYLYGTISLIIKIWYYQ